MIWKGLTLKNKGHFWKLGNFLGILCKELGTTAKHIFVFYHFIEIGRKKKNPLLSWHTCKHAQLCSILCGPMDCSPPGCSVHGIFQARILEWLPFPTPEDLSNPGIKPCLLHWQVDPLPLNHIVCISTMEYFQAFLWILSTMFILVLLTFYVNIYIEKSYHYCIMSINQISS